MYLFMYSSSMIKKEADAELKNGEVIELDKILVIHVIIIDCLLLVCTESENGHGFFFFFTHCLLVITN